MGMPDARRWTSSTSAMIASAISGADWAPRSSPIGTRTRERLLRHAILAQEVQDRGAAPAAAEQADVADRCAERVREHRHVVLVVVGDQHEAPSWR